MSTDFEYARNPRKNDAVVDKMVACIKEFGFRIPIVAKSDGSVVDGHLRLKAAKKLGLKEVPVVVAEWAEWNCQAPNCCTKRKLAFREELIKARGAV